MSSYEQLEFKMDVTRASAENRGKNSGKCGSFQGQVLRALVMNEM